MASVGNVLKTTTKKDDVTLNWSAYELISFRADQNGRVERVNDNKKVYKDACSYRGTTKNNERGRGRCGVKRLMEMSVWYSRVVV